MELVIMADEKERKIPVLTVLKNNAILKNIFVIDQPPPGISEPQRLDNVSEEILMVGRHPDCNIMLTHPSISRFHLQIYSNPTLQKLSVMDLSSVHGTWVSGTKIEPCSRVELKEGDTIRLGASSRIYKLRWVPLSRAYNLEDPFLSASDLMTEEEKEVEIYQEVNSFAVDSEQIQSLDPVLNGMESFFPDENCEPFMEKPIPSAPLEPENTNYSVSDEEKEEDEDLPLVEVFEEIQSHRPPTKEYEQTEIQCAVNWLPSSKVPLERTEDEDINDPQPLFVSEFFSQGENSVGLPIKFGQMPKLHGSLDSSVSDDKIRIPLAAGDLEEVENKKTPREGYEVKEASNLYAFTADFFDLSDPGRNILSDIGDQQFTKENQPTKPLPVTLGLSGDENMESPPASLEQISNLFNMLSTKGEPASVLCAANLLPSAEVLLETKTKPLDEEIKSTHPLFVSEVFPTKSVKTSKLLGSTGSSFVDDKIEIPLAAEVLEEGVENQSPPRKGYGQREASSLYLEALTNESINLPVLCMNVLSDIGAQRFSKEALPVTLGLSAYENSESPPARLEEKSNLPNIWSRRGKPASVLQIQTGGSRRKSKGGSNGAKIRKPKGENSENKPISRALLFPNSDGEEAEIFTPNKENYSPNTLLLKSMNKNHVLQEAKQSTLCRSSLSKFSISPNNCSEEDKENQTPQVLETQKPVRSSPESLSTNCQKLEHEMVMKKGKERVPFHCLLGSAGGKSKSGDSNIGTKNRSSNSGNCTGTTGNATNFSFNNSVGEGKRRWNMVVDATCLLNTESRKSLQLLQGLKGTQLIIPRMVIRELDCLKRRGSLFRRTSEVSTALQWIEDCMVKTKWWIHVQSSVEEGRPVAPTPPATPQFSEGSGSFTSGMTSSVPFSVCGTLMEIVSPTAQDHILECALFFRRVNDDASLVLLSNDVTLKIKAMAEGLNCETVEEFRESLVNPFSERFMWSDSCPRGQTWSCADDVVLREKYHRCPLKKAVTRGGEGAKGLKLILLHNSHYGQPVQSVNSNMEKFALSHSKEN